MQDAQVLVTALSILVAGVLSPIVIYVNRKADRARSEVTELRREFTELALRIVGSYPDEAKVRQIMTDQLHPLRIELRNMHNEMFRMRDALAAAPRPSPG